MSLDRLQSKQGLFSIQGEPGYTVASSLSSVLTNQFPAGYNFGSAFLVAPATAGSKGGGALVYNIKSGAQTYAASSGTGAYITHDNEPLVVCSLSAGGLHNLQPPAYHGQQLTVLNYANVSGSIVTGAVISGQGTGSTTTAVVPTLTIATTFTSYGNLKFIALATYGGSASNSTSALWQCIG